MRWLADFLFSKHLVRDQMETIKRLQYDLVVAQAEAARLYRENHELYCAFWAVVRVAGPVSVPLEELKREPSGTNMSTNQMKRMRDFWVEMPNSNSAV